MTEQQGASGVQSVLRIGGMVVAAGSALAALAVMSGFFLHPTWFGGDHLYQRGVAASVASGRIVGEDYFSGHLSYFSGSYHLLFGYAGRLLSVSYDGLVVAASWAFGPLWVGALILLATRLWPGDWLRAGLFALIGTFAAPFTTDVTDLWVEAVLPSGHAMFPVYPRDLALAGLLVAIWAAMSPVRWVRIVVGGLLLALVVTMHAQIGVVIGPIVVVAAIVRPAAGPWRDRVLDAVGLIAIAVLAALWWIVPHGAAVLEASPVELASYPGRDPFSLAPGLLATALGVVLPLAVVGAIVFVVRRGWLDGRAIVAVWLGWLVLVASAAAVLGIDGVLPARRAVLLASLPFAALAADGLAALVEAVSRARWSAVAAVAMAVAVVIVPSLPALGETQAWVDDRWVGPVAVNDVVFDGPTWAPIWEDLSGRLRDDRGFSVLTYEPYGSTVWSFTGVPVVSMWLPGTYKLGYDIEETTGFTLEERVELQNAAFARGIPGLCDLAATFDVDAMVLERTEGRVGTRDLWVASQFRGERAERDEGDLAWAIGEGLVYLDRNELDAVSIGEGAALTVPWSTPDVRTVRVVVRNREFVPAVVEVRVGDVVETTTVPPRYSDAEPPRRAVVELELPDGLTDGVTIGALEHDVELLRVTGFEEVAGLAGPDGPFVVDVGTLCSSDPTG